MIDTTQLERSKAIQQETGRTFHVATRLLPRRIEDATYVLYAFFRIADDVVDDPDPPSASRQRAELERIRAAALGERPTDDPVLEAFTDVSAEYGIRATEVDEFIDSMQRDIAIDRYDSHDDLAAYLRGSAVAVGNMMLAVMDPDDREAARPHAKALAEAFQLTNFLRDVREDVLKYDRIYLPRSRRDEYGVEEGQIERLEFSEEFAALMRAELARTERLYREGVAGISHLPADCQFGVLLSAVLYADHHRLIRSRDYDVLTEQPSLSTRRRLALCVRTWWHWRRTGDPEAAFEAASALPADERDDRPPVAGDRTEADANEGAEPVQPGDSDRSSHVGGVVRTLRTLLSPGGPN